MRKQPLLNSVCALSICMTLGACDKVTVLKVQLDAGRPIDANCIPGLEAALGPVDGFYRGNQSSSSVAAEIQVVRGHGTVHLRRDDPASHVLDFNLMWLGPSNELRDKDSVALFTHMRDTVFRTCGLDANTAKVTSRCSGSICEYAEAAALNPM